MAPTNCDSSIQEGTFDANRVKDRMFWAPCLVALEVMNISELQVLSS